jgi:recombination DNA repair RAD52 pathway protein
MALTTEQQAQVDMQIAVQTSIVNAQAAASAVETAKQRKLQCLNIAHTTLLENKRNLPVEQRQITPADITAFADTLTAYVNG